MAFIRTMLGDIAPEKLGFTYSHEHIVCRPQHWVDRNADDLLLDDPAKSQQEVALFRDAGGRSLVDATAVDYGRDPAAVREISRATGVQIVGTAASTRAFCGMPACLARPAPLNNGSKAPPWTILRALSSMKWNTA